MHLPDGLVTCPINLANAALAMLAVASAARHSATTLTGRQAPLLGMAAAIVFAAQTLDFPVAAGTSGHVLGATFALVLLGPAAACLVLSLVLTLQCLLLGDGGPASLGTNIVSMAVVGVLVPALVLALLRTVLPRSRAAGLATVAVAAWCSVVAASAACATALAASGHPPSLLPAMLGAHAGMAVGEALITTALVSVVLSARPDLLPGHSPRPVTA